MYNGKFNLSSSIFIASLNFNVTFYILTKIYRRQLYSYYTGQPDYSIMQTSLILSLFF